MGLLKWSDHVHGNEQHRVRRHPGYVQLVACGHAGVTHGGERPVRDTTTGLPRGIVGEKPVNPWAGRSTIGSYDGLWSAPARIEGSGRKRRRRNRAPDLRAGAPGPKPQGDTESYEGSAHSAEECPEGQARRIECTVLVQRPALTRGADSLPHGVRPWAHRARHVAREPDEIDPAAHDATHGAASGEDQSGGSAHGVIQRSRVAGCPEPNGPSR